MLSENENIVTENPPPEDGSEAGASNGVAAGTRQALPERIIDIPDYRTLLKEHGKDLLGFFELITKPGDVFEIRAFEAWGDGRGKYASTGIGYFDRAHLRDAVQEAMMVATEGTASATCFSLNTVPDFFLAKAGHKVQKARSGGAKDEDISRLRLLLVDVDTKRPDAKISSTDQEKAFAWELANSVRMYLRERGFLDPIVLDSGNGFHLLYSIDLPVEDSGLIERFLKKLAGVFADFDGADVDTTVANPSRVSKIPFTPVRKGTSTADRPHSLSSVVKAPTEFKANSREIIESVAGPIQDAFAARGGAGERAENPKRNNGNNGGAEGQYTSRLMVDRWLEDRGLAYEVKKAKATGNRTVYLLTECPFNPGHNGTDTCIMQGDDGRMSAKCLHNSCSGLGWQEFKHQIGAPNRQHYDPPIEPSKPKRREHRKPAAGLPSKSSSKGACTGYPCTDYGNAQRLATLHGADIRYCYPWSKWLAWDGKRWRIDQTGEVERRAKKTVRNILREAADTEGKEERGRLIDWAGTSEWASHIAAMIRLCPSEPGVCILPEEMDNDIWLLNCTNGTLDLRTGQLRDHCREDKITKLCPVALDPDAACPVWESFMDKIFASNSEIISYVQRFLGYCLTGNVSEQIMPVFWGGGSNGKSTLLGTIMGMFGKDYATKATSDLFMSKDKENHPTEKADLFGRRFAFCVETEENRRLSESLIKDLTGGDVQKARRMREDFWEFNPTHKVVLCTNHVPRVTGTDHAMWRRIRLIPFSVTIPDDQQDLDLPNKLRAELPGILAWCLRGCLAWQRDGLGKPKEVELATATYRLQQDVLGSFLEECCHQGADYRSRASVLYTVYQIWCDDNGEKSRANQRRFGISLTERGVERYTDNGTKYRGVAPRTEWMDKYEKRHGIKTTEATE